MQITKDQAQKIIEAADEVITAMAGTNEDVHPESDNMLRLWDDLNDRYAPPEVVRELARIALASLEAEPVAEWTNEQCLEFLSIAFRHAEIKGDLEFDDIRLGVKMVNGSRAAPPAPVSVPDEHYQNLSELYHAQEKRLFKLAQRIKGPSFDKYAHSPSQAIDVLESALFGEHDDDCRAAMLQGAEQQNQQQNIPENIPATQFKPVSDLYELTVPSGRSTTFTKDAAEASDCRVMGWFVQEYVKLERYQNAMLQGAGHVTTTYKLRDAVETIRNSGIAIDAEKIFAERDALNASDCWCHTCRPVTISDMRFVVCPECGNKRCPHANDHRNACTGSNEPGQEGSAYPAAPQQEISHALAKGMERYGDAMQELAKQEVK